MKFLVLTVLVAVAFAKNIPTQNEKLTKLLSNYGYPIESYTVNTEDGYILQLFRIPHGIQNNQNNKKHDSPRPAVLLMHGFWSSCDDFLSGGPSQGLAFQLADQGYDVYLGNARGSTYGQQHTSLDPRRDGAFWRFSFHEIGVADLSAIIDQVISISQQNKISYVGHMEGASIFYILASQRNQYNQKVDRAIALGPVAYLKNSEHNMLEQITQNYYSKNWIIKNVGMSTFSPSSELQNDDQKECQNSQQSQQQERICQNAYFLFNGYNSDNFNQSTISQVLSRLPSDGSVHQVLHLAQMKNSGRFENYSFNNNQRKAPFRYDLSRVTVPVAIFYAPNDALAHVNDVQTLASDLLNVYRNERQDNFDNNLDMLYANDVDQFNKQVVNALREDVPVPQHQKKRSTMTKH